MANRLPCVSSYQSLREQNPTDLFMKENIAIVMAYFSIGVVGSFISTPLNVYLVHTLNAEPPIQNTIGILSSLPWSLKLVFGFLSDACPLWGMRRKPYLCIGTLVYSAAFVSYALIGVENIVFLAICVFVGTLGLIVLDVMADTMCVERSKFEPESTKGQMQATCYSVRFAGGLVGAISGASVCNQELWGWGLTFPQVALITALVPFVLVVPWLFFLKEKYNSRAMLVDADVNVEMTKKVESKIPIDSFQSTSDREVQRTTTGAGRRAHGTCDYDEVVYTIKNRGEGESASRLIEGEMGGREGELADDREGKKEKAEEEEEEGVSIRQQLHEIWQTVQLQAVWRPMAFVYLYNICQIPNVAWQSFLQLSLHFEPWVLGLTVILGSCMTLVGVLAYKNLFFNASWRSIYLWSTGLTAFFSLMQLLLIFQINVKYLHISNYFFSIGDDVITAYISGIQFLPVSASFRDNIPLRMLINDDCGFDYVCARARLGWVALWPHCVLMANQILPYVDVACRFASCTCVCVRRGRRGHPSACSFGNIALIAASNIGSHLTSIWNVSNEAMRAHDVSGLWRLTVMTSSISLVPLTMLHLLPRDAEEQQQLAVSKHRSPLGGAIFLIVLFASLLWTISSAVMKLV